MMADAKPTTATRRTPREIPVAKPRWAFSKGFLTGAAIEIPAVAATVWVLGMVGIGDPEVGFMRIMRLTAVFCGLAALITAGGVGRLAAQGAVDGGRKRAVYVAMRAHAAAGMGLVVIAAIPHGHLPTRPVEWAMLAGAGLVPGALCGAVIGLVCGGITPVGFADVWSLAQRPSEALRQLLDPKDLVKLGSALRSRTSQMFEGIFEPAPLPPKQGEPVPVVAKPEEAKPAELAKPASKGPAKEPASKGPATKGPATKGPSKGPTNKGIDEA